MLVRRFDPSGGGTERDFAAAAQCLSRAGHEVRIHAARAASTSWHGMRVRKLPVPVFPRSLEVIGFGLLAGRVARREGAELTISFGRTTDCDFIRCEGGAHAAYLEAARQWESGAASAARALSPYHAAQCRIEELGLRSGRLKLVLAISNLVGDDLKRRFNLPAGKVQTLYNGVDHRRFQHASDPQRRAAIRGALAIDSSTPVVLFVGHGFRRKGLGQLIEALPLCGANPLLLVAGEDHAMEFFRRAARRLRIEPRVRFLGRRGDIPDLMAAADAVALPSLFEAFGNVVLEGMAAGRAVLTTARCGAAEVLPPPMRRFVVRNAMDPAELARQLDALLEAGPELGAIARAAAAQFTWQRFGERLVELVERAAR